MTEADFQRRVLDLAAIHHWRTTHFRPARTDKGWRTPMEGDKGWPDVVFARQRDGKGRLVVAELKTERGVVEPDQTIWLNLLATCPGVEVYVWRPSLWQEVVSVLGRAA